MRLSFFFILSLFLFSCHAKVEEEHKICKSDADCVLIGQGSCCGQDVAVNKKFKDKLQKSPEDRCQTMNVLCSPVKAICKEQQCLMVPEIK